MTLNDLLTDKGIEPGRVLVLRHSSVRTETQQSAAMASR